MLSTSGLLQTIQNGNSFRDRCVIGTSIRQGRLGVILNAKIMQKNYAKIQTPITSPPGDRFLKTQFFLKALLKLYLA